MRKQVVSVRVMGALALALFGSALAAPTIHAEDWPTRPVRILIPFTAGGTAHMLGRLAAEKLSLAFRPQIVPEHKPGASGLISPPPTAKSAPRRSTLVVSLA